VRGFCQFILVLTFLTSPFSWPQQTFGERSAQDGQNTSAEMDKLIQRQKRVNEGKATTEDLEAINLEKEQSYVDPNKRRAEPLTDEDKKKAKEYVHKGYQDKKFQEFCNNKKNRDVCSGDEATVFKDEATDGLVQQVGKLYSLFGALGGSTSAADQGIATEENGVTTYNDGSVKIKNGDETETKSNKSSPLCDKIPQGTEMVAGVSQQYGNQQINSVPAKPGTQQREELLKVSRTHKERVNTASIQTTGWSSAAVCYIGSAAANSYNGGAFSDPQLYLKTAASVGLGGFYAMKIKAHQDYSKRAKELAERMPKNGACNPYTQVQCFCAEPSSIQQKEFIQTCIAKPFRSRFKPDSIAGPCIDRNGNADVSCDCQKTGNCFDSTIRAFSGGLNFGTASGQNTLDDLQALSRGSLNSASANSNNLARLANAKRFLQNAPFPDTTNLTDKQKRNSKLLEDLGIPAKFARYIAAKVPPAPASVIAKIGAPIPTQYRNYEKDYSNNSVIRSKKGYDNNSRSRSNNNRGHKTNTIQANNKGTRAGTSQILKFQDQATKQADIAKDDGKNLFDIVSHRYQLRAWKDFDIMDIIGKKENVEKEN